MLLHVGGNDLGKSPIKELKNVMRELFDFIEENMPGVNLIWSEILPRHWGSGNEGLESARKRMNTQLRLGGVSTYGTLICRLLIGPNITWTGSICHHQAINCSLTTLRKGLSNF